MRRRRPGRSRRRRPGLRRARKPADAGKAGVREDSGESGSLIVDGGTAAFQKGTPAEAHRACNASGVCAHIAAAVLFLREKSASETDVAAAPDEPEKPSAEEDLLRLSFSEIFKRAGKPGTSMAARIPASTPDAGRKIETDPGS